MCVTYGCVLDVEIEYKMILNDFFIKETKEVKNFTKLCNEYNIVGSSPLIFDVFAKFRAVCES